MSTQLTPTFKVPLRRVPAAMDEHSSPGALTECLGILGYPRCRCLFAPCLSEDLVYLSADSPDTINQLEEDKVYIIGGLVDRNAHKGLCFRKATVSRG